MSEKKTTPNEAARAYLSAIGRKGGKARTSRLTSHGRKALARKAARARWGKRKSKKR